MNNYDQLMERLTDFGDAPLEKQSPNYKSETELALLQSKLGYSLPHDYQEFLRDYGGFHVYKYILIPRSQEFDSSEAEISTFFGVDFLLQNQLITAEDEKFLPDAPLLIGVSEKGYTLISLSGDQKGKVFYWDRSQRSKILESENIYLVSDSFDEFLHLLAR